MNMHEIITENITDTETIECIRVFDEEMLILLNKTADIGDIEIEKYLRKPSDGEIMPPDIRMVFTLNGVQNDLVFKESYFEDYCFSNRKERNELLKHIIDQIKSRLHK